MYGECVCLRTLQSFLSSFLIPSSSFLLSLLLPPLPPPPSSPSSPSSFLLSLLLPPLPPSPSSPSSLSSSPPLPLLSLLLPRLVYVCVYVCVCSLASQTHFWKKGRVWWTAYTSCVPPHCTVRPNHVAVFCHMTHYITVWVAMAVLRTVRGS